MRSYNKVEFFVVLLSAALFPATGTALAQRPTARVVVVPAQMREAPSTITLVGTVNAVRRSRVGSEIAGLVESMPCRQGDLVQAGGILCELNNDTLTHELAEAEARLHALTARHVELLAGTRREELARLKAAVEEAAARHDRWKFEMVRIEKLYEGSESNQREVYDTRAELRAADQRRAAVQAQYDEGLAGPREEVIERAAFDAAAQKAVVDRIKSDLAKAVIRAPFTGYVVQRTTEVGEWISAGGLVVEIADLSTVLVGVDAPESCLPYLSVGDAARIEVDALRRSFEGHIKHIIRQADEYARTFPVEIELDNGSGLLAGGMFARATVLAGPKKKVVTIPKDAHVKRDGVDYVAVAMPGEQGGLMGILMAVTVGAEIGDWIAIESGGVRPGTLVITRGTEGIMPFPSPITVVDESGSPVSKPSDHGGATGRGHG